MLNIIIDVEDEEKEGMPDLESSSSEPGDEEVHSDISDESEESETISAG